MYTKISKYVYTLTLCGFAEWISSDWPKLDFKIRREYLKNSYEAYESVNERRFFFRLYLENRRETEFGSYIHTIHTSIF